MPDFSHLPVILAGPIVRRVQPTSASVWVALSRSANVQVGLWIGDTAAGAGFFGTAGAEHSGSSATLRVGAKLHIALVTLDLSASPLLPGVSYAYNVVIDGTQDLNSLHLLEDQGSPGSPDHVALGYVAGLLPSFVLPPALLEQVRVVHGSCRKPHGFGPDGLAPLDQIIERTRALADHSRPQQLFLTGDQIYADDVAVALLPQLTVAGNELLGTVEQLPLTGLPGTTATVPIDATEQHFPPTWRQTLIKKHCRFTSGEGANHLLSLGEFCAMYLFAWSGVLWSDLATADQVLGADSDPKDKAVAQAQADLRKFYEGDVARLSQDRKVLREHYKGEAKRLAQFRAGLPRVRRALANIATYMIFDDHEITDDWYLTQDWRNQVLASTLGVTAVRNGLLAYAFFQGWGNDPVAFATGDRRQLLDLAGQLFTAGRPDTALAGQIDVLLGLDGADPPVRWDYTVPTGPTTTVFLDTRTRRTYPGRLEPPGLMSDAALDDQLPASLLPSPGAGALIVVSPAPVIGLALIEELLQPLLARVKSDFFGGVIQGHQPAVSGYLDWDFEAWSLDPAQFEKFLARCAELGPVVLLSGDVHYGFSAQLDYFKPSAGPPSRIVQLTSSALKNEWDPGIKRALETSAGQVLLQSTLNPIERLGWNNPLDVIGRLHVPGDRIPRGRLSQLRQTPALAPASGWPAGTTLEAAGKPVWGWRMSIVKDERPDSSAPGARPADAQATVITPDIDPGSLADLARVLRRSEAQLASKIARSTVFASHLGLVSFATAPDLSVTHTFMYQHAGTRKPLDPQAYTAHTMSLEATTDTAPELS
jgi:hypothetical protein